MKRIILASHADYSKGLRGALNLILGNENAIDVIEGFTVDLNPITKFEKIISAYDENDTVIVLTDLTAGSVNKLIAEKLNDRKFYLISGTNLAVLLQLAMASEESITEEYIEHVIKMGKDDITFVNRLLKETVQKENENDFL